MLAKYHEGSDANPTYITALLFHSEKSRRYIDRHWPEEWRDRSTAGARQLWAKYRNRSLVATGHCGRQSTGLRLHHKAIWQGASSIALLLIVQKPRPQLCRWSARISCALAGAAKLMRPHRCGSGDVAETWPDDGAKAWSRDRAPH